MNQKKKPVSAQTVAKFLEEAEEEEKDEDDDLGLIVDSPSTKSNVIKVEASTAEKEFGRVTSSFDATLTKPDKKISPEVILDDEQEKLKKILLGLLESPDVQAMIHRSSSESVSPPKGWKPNRDRATTNVNDKPKKFKRQPPVMIDNDSVFDEDADGPEELDSQDLEVIEMKKERAKSKLTPSLRKEIQPQTPQ